MPKSAESIIAKPFCAIFLRTAPTPWQKGRFIYNYDRVVQVYKLYIFIYFRKQIQTIIKGKTGGFH